MTCALQRGFGVRLVVQDWSGSKVLFPTEGRRPTTRWDPGELAGVEILADGVLVGTSDEREVAEVDLPSEPGRIEARLAGWRVLDSYWFRDGKVLSFPEAEISMIRE